MKNETIREFIERRIAEIASIQAGLLNELRELESAKAAIDGKSVKPNETTALANAPTIKEMVCKVLEDYPEGLPPNSILESINSRFKTSVVRSSLSPQLSRLKASGKLNLDEEKGLWKLSNPNLKESVHITPNPLRPHVLRRRIATTKRSSHKTQEGDDQT